MRRVRFPEFAKLPSDLQMIIFDYIHDRRDPIGINVPDRADFADVRDHKTAVRKEALQHWAQLRLVCKEWSVWFSLDAVRHFIGKLDKLASDGFLEGMASLTSLEIYNPTEAPEAGQLQPEAIKHLATMIPTSLRYLNSCSVELLKSLSKSKASALQTVIFSCNASEARVVQSVKSVSDKFSGRIKHLKVRFTFVSQINSWDEALTDCSVEELTLEMESGSRGTLPELPSTLKRLNVVNIQYIDADWLSPVAGSLEVLNAPNSKLFIHFDMPVFYSLKEIFVDEVEFFSEDYSGEELDRYYRDETLLSSHWPSLEKFQLNGPRDSLLPPGLSKIPTLRSICINDQHHWEIGVNLSQLPPSLEELEYWSEKFGRIEGQPSQEMKHLRKLHVRIDQFNLPKGVFRSMPALEELSLRLNWSSQYEGIDLKELLPLRHSLVDLNAIVCGNSASKKNVLYQFSRLTSLRLCGEPCNLGKLPRSLQKLGIYGDFVVGPMEPLLDLKLLEVSYSRVSVQLMIDLLRHAPNLRIASLDLDEKEKVKKFLEEMKGQALKGLTKLEFEGGLVPLTEGVIQLLEIFPNIEYLHVHKYNCYTKDVTEDFPAQLLPLLKSNPTLGMRLGTIKIGDGLKLEELNEASKAAFKELRGIGIQLVEKAYN